MHNPAKCKADSYSSRYCDFTYHNQSSSERTVPTKPLTRSSVHTLELGGNSNFSIPVRSQIRTSGSRRRKSNSPTNPECESKRREAHDSTDIYMYVYMFEIV